MCLSCCDFSEMFGVTLYATESEDLCHLDFLCLCSVVISVLVFCVVTDKTEGQEV